MPKFIMYLPAVFGFSTYIAPLQYLGNIVPKQKSQKF